MNEAGPFRQAIWDSGLDPPDRNVGRPLVCIFTHDIRMRVSLCIFIIIPNGHRMLFYRVESLLATAHISTHLMNA